MNFCRTIVIVDDEADILWLLTLFLEKSGWRVLVFENAIEAIARIELGDVDVVLSDVRMPKMSGIELFKDVRGRHPYLPFVLMTGFSAVDQPLLASIDCQVLVKPFELTEMHRVLVEAIEVSGR